MIGMSQALHLLINNDIEFSVAGGRERQTAKKAFSPQILLK
jgi:hypothetical protein